MTDFCEHNKATCSQRKGKEVFQFTSFSKLLILTGIKLGTLEHESIILSPKPIMTMSALSDLCHSSKCHGASDLPVRKEKCLKVGAKKPSADNWTKLSAKTILMKISFLFQRWTLIVDWAFHTWTTFAWKELSQLLRNSALRRSGWQKLILVMLISKMGTLEKII